MSLSNDNNRGKVSVYVGTLATDDTQVPVCHFAKKVKILSVKLINNAVVAANDSNYVQPSLQHVGGNVIAELDTRAAHEGALAKNVGKAMNIVEAEQYVAAGSDLELDYQEAGTVTLTAAVLEIDYLEL
jgi:hypothetical protein